MNGQQTLGSAAPLGSTPPPQMAHHLHALPAPEDGWKMLLTKEVLRFWRVALQTIAAPVLTSVLYLLIFGHVMGACRSTRASATWPFWCRAW